MFSALSWLLGGVFVPVSLLPAPLQRLAAWLPITHVVDALRQVVLRGATLADIRADVLVLSAITAVGVPAGVLAVQFGIDRAKRAGSLAHI
jgi:ABC-2 type transport system permease protein